MYRAGDLLTVAAPMAGLGPDDISVEITDDGRLVLDGRVCHDPKIDCAMLSGHKDVLIDDWTIGPYHREISLGAPVDGPAATVTYGNGVLVVAMPVADATRAARLTLEPAGPSRGARTDAGASARRRAGEAR
jgi:HSP20 family protein